MVFELTGFFHVDPGEDLRRPVHRGIAVFSVLGYARMGPVALFSGFFVFSGSFVDATASFTYVDGVRFTFAVKFVNAFAITGGRSRFVFAA